MPPRWGHLVSVVLALSTARPSTARICGDVELRNDLSDMDKQLQNCTVVAGNLHILLMENPSVLDFDRFVYPQLREVLGSVIVYKITKLISLGRLFPNLEFIMGTKPFEDYSLILQNVPNMTEIGLTKLKRIERGSVRISQCPNLCHATSVNWTTLGTKLFYDNKENRSCTGCHEKCHGHCWNDNDCQDMTSLVRCPHFEDGTKCVEKCPDNTYILVPGNKCISRAECSSLHIGPNSVKWFILNDTCTNRCPARHKLIIDGDNNTQCVWIGRVKCVPKFPVDSLSTLESFKDCEYVNGSLTLRIEKRSLADELPLYLGNITEIRDYLKIHRSPALKNFDFLKSLRKVGGETLSGGNAVIVLDNHNLVKLWDVENFSLVIENGGLSFHYNHRLCLSDIKEFARLTNRTNYTDLDVSPRSNGDQGVCEPFIHDIKIMEYNSTNVTLQWDVINSTTGGYFVYYKEAGVVSNDSCGDDWAVVVGAANTRVLIINLKPFTEYTYYLMMNSNSSHPYSRTKQHTFKTLADDPSAPVRIAAVSSSWDTMTITWDPPKEPRGELDRYVITQRVEPDTDDFIWQRDYCNYPLREVHHEVVVAPQHTPAKNECACETGGASTERSLEQECRTFVPFNESPRSSRCKMYFAYTFDDRFAKQHARQKRMAVSGELVESYAGAGEREYTIRDLRPFTIYVFMVSACNKNISDRQLCSEVVMVSNRTHARPGADDITSWSVALGAQGIEVVWKEPLHPNSLIVSYEIEHRQLNVDNVKPIEACVTQRRHQQSGGAHMMHLPPGKYGFRLRAVSLSGPGNYTSQKDVTVGDKSDQWALVGSVSFCVLLAAAAIGFYLYYRWKKKHEHEKLHLITSVNPDYAGPAYMEDEWETERCHVEITKDVGQGSFGMVYSGFIHSKPCAIKTVNDNANFEDRVEFLNEASVMKSFSEAHHVVRLLGVVSRGQPPLVVMELMACGDLKSFLRKSRDSSQSITLNEMYRMAAEIGDGMAYLAAKKFIHRDLAARNCMVSADHTIKIGDFGMARDVYATDYYRKETKGLLPVRWMAPESLADGVFTTDSDAWSYGVVLWEMVTLAEQPYQGLSNEQVFQFVIARGTLDRPSDCPDLLYDVMQVCWKWRPNSRPLFTDIVKNFDGHVGQDFQLVSFYHSREGEEHRMNAKERPQNQPAMSAAPEAQIFARYNVSDDDISLCNGDRDTTFLSFPHQRHSRLSDYSLNTSPKNGHPSYSLTPK